MSDRRAHWPDASAPDTGFVVKVTRTGRPPLPWTWEIVNENGKAGDRRSSPAYPSAEDAWAAGRAALADLDTAGDPSR